MGRAWLDTALAFVLIAAISGRASRAGDAIDFGRDVQPLFKAHCYGAVPK